MVTKTINDILKIEHELEKATATTNQPAFAEEAAKESLKIVEKLTLTPLGMAESWAKKALDNSRQEDILF